MARDGRGLEVSNAGAEAIAALDLLTAEWLAYGARLPDLVVAARSERRCALLPLLAANLLLSAHSSDAFDQAQQHFERAQALATQADPRETAWLAATAAWLAGARDRAQEIHEDMADEWPRDLLSARLGQQHALHRGDAEAMLRIGTRILPANREDHHAWAMSAYGLAQCNRLAEAEAHARRAIELERRDPCAHQVVAQCLQARGRLLEGVTFLQSVADTWDACHSSMYTHNWWQLALLLIELDQSREALALFDQRVWGVRKSFCADQVNAVSLLAWLELRGVDVGRRWDDVAAHLETRLHEHFSPLLDLHYVHGLARAGRTHAATEMLASLEDRAERATAAEREAWADCAVPMAHGLVGYAKSDFAGAARLMGRAMPHLRAIGGGIDRRGLFAALHLDALIKSGWNDAALAILQAHERARPAVPSIKLALGDLYRRLGRSEQALLAEHQAARLACPPRQVAGAASGTPGASGGQPGCAALPEA